MDETMDSRARRLCIEESLPKAEQMQLRDKALKLWDNAGSNVSTLDEG